MNLTRHTRSNWLDRCVLCAESEVCDFFRRGLTSPSCPHWPFQSLHHFIVSSVISDRWRNGNKRLGIAVQVSVQCHLMSPKDRPMGTILFPHNVLDCAGFKTCQCLDQSFHRIKTIHTKSHATCSHLAHDVQSCTDSLHDPCQKTIRSRVATTLNQRTTSITNFVNCVIHNAQFKCQTEKTKEMILFLRTPDEHVRRCDP